MKDQSPTQLPSEGSVTVFLAGLPAFSASHLVLAYMTCAADHGFDSLDADTNAQTVSLRHTMYSQPWLATFSFSPDCNSVRSVRLTLEASGEVREAVTEKVMHDIASYGAESKASEANFRGGASAIAAPVSVRLTCSGQLQLIIEYGLAPSAGISRHAA
jgi:hypothetical protein